MGRAGQVPKGDNGKGAALAFPRADQSTDMLWLAPACPACLGPPSPALQGESGKMSASDTTSAIFVK